MNASEQISEGEPRLEVAFDRPVVSVRGSSVRYLIAEVEAPSAPTGETERLPLNLALVVDASGSMKGLRIETARAAAQQVAAGLDGSDRLSVVSFDSEITTHLRGVRLDDTGRVRAAAALGGLRAGSMTHLSGGWLAGAEAVAEVMAEGQPCRSHVVLFSDGMANQGVTDPGELARHATELRQRGLYSSTVGIGDGYETAQLQAIAESGGGRLHDAELPHEIASVLLGELGEIQATVAENVVLSVSHPAEFRVEVLGPYPVERGEARTVVPLGPLTGGSRRTAVLRITCPVGPEGESRSFEAVLGWRAPGTGELHTGPAQGVSLRFGGRAELEAQAVEPRIAETVVRQWHADLVLRVSDLNRAGAYTGAAKLLDEQLHHLGRYCRDLPACEPLLRDLGELRHRADRDWGERTRKEMHRSSYVTSKGLVDHRGRQDRLTSGHGPGREEHYRYRLYGGHVCVELPGAMLLVDTGSPVSCARRGHVSLLRRSLAVPQSVLGLTAERLSGMVGTPVDGLLGMDILQRFVVGIDPEAGRISVTEPARDRSEPRGRDAGRSGSVWLPLQELAGIPLADVSVAGRRYRAVIDTSARVSYAPRGALTGASVIGEAEDFFPGFGDFRTPLVSLPLELGQHRIDLAFGELPAPLATLTERFGIEVILGTQLLEVFRLVLDFPGGQAILEPIAAAAQRA